MIALAAMVEGCGPSGRPLSFPSWPEGIPLVHWYDAEPVASEDYAALIGNTDFGGSAPRIRAERGVVHCGSFATRRPDDMASRISPCPPDLEAALATVRRPSLVMWKNGGLRVIAGARVGGFLAPIDSPAKAALVVYGLSLDAGEGIEMDVVAAPVRAVAGGFEVFVGATDSTGECGAPDSVRMRRYYDAIMFVREDGRVDVRSRDLVGDERLMDGCQPL
jgi:hypothetical protein